MSARFTKTAHIAAGSQLAGTELSAQTRAGLALLVAEVLLHMGSESKTWKLIKTWKNSAGDLISSVVRQSVDANGVPAADTTSDVALTGSDINITLLPGEQLQAITVGATAAIDLYVQYQEIDVSETRRLSDPIRTR